MGWIFDKNTNSYTFVPEGKIDNRGQYNKGDYTGFTSDMYPAMYQAFINNGFTEQTSDQLARFATIHKAMESGYGSHIFGENQGITYNYGGIGGQEAKQSFSDINDYANQFVSTLTNKYPNAIQATNLQEYSDGLFEDTYGYDPVDTKEERVTNPKNYNKKVSQTRYYKKLKGVEQRTNKSIDLILQNGTLKDKQLDQKIQDMWFKPIEVIDYFKLK